MIGFVNVSFDFPPQCQRGRPAGWHYSSRKLEGYRGEGRSGKQEGDHVEEEEKFNWIGCQWNVNWSKAAPPLAGGSFAQPPPPPRIASNSKGLKLKILFPRRFLAKAASLVFDTLQMTGEGVEWMETRG